MCLSTIHVVCVLLVSHPQSCAHHTVGLAWGMISEVSIEIECGKGVSFDKVFISGAGLLHVSCMWALAS